MIAVPLIFLADAIVGSFASKVAFFAGLTVIPIALRKKEVLEREDHYGFSLDRDLVLLIEKHRNRGSTITRREAKKMLDDPESPENDGLMYIKYPEEALPPEMQEFAGEYVLTPSERVELTLFVIQHQARLGKGPLGQIFKAANITDQMFSLAPEDDERLLARIRLLKNHYTPLRMQHAGVRKMVAASIAELAA